MIGTNRDRSTGRYVDTNFEKPCRCGHTLGNHTAARVDGKQHCLAVTLGQCCECESFKVARKTGGAK